MRMIGDDQGVWSSREVRSGKRPTSPEEAMGFRLSGPAPAEFGGQLSVRFQYKDGAAPRAACAPIFVA